MKISTFFLALRSAYQAEMDDMTFDSEGQDVLRHRLADRRKEIGFLLKMIELSPEMVAVIFHQGFQFRLPAVMDHLLTHEPDDFPEWDSLSDAIAVLPAAQDLTRLVLKEPMGEWFLTVAAALEYMYSKPDTMARPDHDDEDSEEGDDDGTAKDRLSSDPAGGADGEDERDEQAREEAGADWLAEQGFDRKE